jgi:DNA-binding NarL/FixJ family response regulator
MMNVRLALVDDNPVYLFALTHVLKNMDEFVVSISSEDFKEYLEALGNEEVDIILIDVSVLLGLRPQILKGYLKYVHDIPVMVMGMDRPSQMDELQTLHPNIRFLAKGSGREKIIEAIRETASLLNWY